MGLYHRYVALLVPDVSVLCFYLVKNKFARQKQCFFHPGYTASFYKMLPRNSQLVSWMENLKLVIIGVTRFPSFSAIFVPEWSSSCCGWSKKKTRTFNGFLLLEYWIENTHMHSLSPFLSHSLSHTLSLTFYFSTSLLHTRAHAHVHNPNPKNTHARKFLCSKRVCRRRRRLFKTVMLQMTSSSPSSFFFFFIWKTPVINPPLVEHSLSKIPG